MDEGNIVCAKNIAVMLIDMQSVFTERIEKEELKIMIDNQLIILDLCAKHDIPLIVLEYNGHKETLVILQEKIKKIVTKQIIIKSENDGFNNTSLSLQLKEWQIKTILLMGVNASACVWATARSAIERGYNIITSKQLIADSPDWCGEKKGWYVENGIFCPDTQDLLAKIKA